MHSELGRLLIFISKVAISARMNTGYNGSSVDNPGTPQAAMWLTDMLHNFYGLGKSLSDNDRSAAIDEIEVLKRKWMNDSAEIEYSCTVNTHNYDWNVSQGIALLDDLKAAIQACELSPEHSDAWFEGLGAARTGYSLADNGYLENTTEHSDWADGFAALPLYQQGGSSVK